MVSLLAPDATTTLRLDSGRVTLRGPTPSELAATGSAEQDGFCDLLVQRAVPDALAPMFESLRQGFLPAGCDLEGAAEHVTEDGRLHQEPGHAVPPLSVYPRAFREYLRPVFDEMLALTGRCVDLYRWRSRRLGPPEPLSFYAFAFADDGGEWVHLPRCDESPVVPLRGFLAFTAEMQTQVESVLRAGKAEPFGHGLLRESWAMRVTNPRASLLLCITAAEVGFKECVTDLAPDAAWLATEAPSPPLVRMLEEYLPLLPCRLRIRDAVLPPPQGILGPLRKGVTLRNEVAHKPKEIDASELWEVLFAVEDVLWILDYYRGESWALDMLSGDTRKALKLPKQPTIRYHFVEKIP